MTMEAVGGKTKANGKSSPVAAAGPNPGNTPVIIPSPQPITAHIKMLRVSTESKPICKLEIISDIIALQIF
jgi:hypothetical protein